MPKPSNKDLSDTQITPDPKVEKKTRREHSPEYKLKIIQEADACQHGELGKLLRREGLYSNQLKQWRESYADKGVDGLSKSAPGPTPKYTPEQREIEKLKKQNARLTKELEVSNGCLALQKKALDLLELMNDGENQ